MTTATVRQRFLSIKPELLLLVVTLCGFFLRIWQLDSVPPGWRDDELINSLVISQKVLDGEWAVYYPDASGHEALYHVLNAGMLAIFGPGAAGIRLLSAILGTLTIPLTYLVAKRLFGWQAGLVAAAGLAVSFWSLMYSRLGIRHVSLLIFLLPTLYFFATGMGIGIRNHDRGASSSRKMMLNLAAAGLFMGLGFYTYFASRGVPIILLTVLVGMLLFDWEIIRQRWKGIAIMLAVAAVFATPLLTTLASQPESEARVQELAVPLQAARGGDLQPLGEHVTRTINMYHSDGDEEWLYNIPYRPLFAPAVAVIFWIGVGMAILLALSPLIRRSNLSVASRIDGYLAISSRNAAAGGLLLLWWVIGLAPAFVSIPPASLGHTIIAQPSTYIILALPLVGLDRLIRIWGRNRFNARATWLLPVLSAFLLILALAWRDLPAYFQIWPDRGMTRFLYRADLHDVAEYLNRHPEMKDFGITSLLAGPWDREALQISLDGKSGQDARWFDPDRTVLLRVGGLPAQSFTGYPQSTALEASFYRPIPGENAGGYQLSTLKEDVIIDDQEACFQNNLCLLNASYDPEMESLDLIFEISGNLKLPEIPLISNPPPPGVYAGSRLVVFTHVLDADGRTIGNDDGMWIDVQSLKDGDRFLQQHRFVMAADARPASIVIGLYDPMTGERILSDDGRDQIEIDAAERS
jgi:4-amino-4-deoxy-L-arabinose transferase-like glycosyltransferase